MTMPTPSKFKAEVREKIIQALQVGASRTTAAHIAGVDEAQLRRWVAKGKDSSEGTSFREFYEAVMAAEAAPRMRALGIIYKEMPDRPDLAWKFVERREPGYEPPVLNQPNQMGPLVIQLAFADGRPASEIEVIDAEEVPALEAGPGGATAADPADPAPLTP